MTNVARGLLAVSIVLFVIAAVSLFPTARETYHVTQQENARKFLDIERGIEHLAQATQGSLTPLQQQILRGAENDVRSETDEVEQLRNSRYGRVIWCGVFGFVFLGGYFRLKLAKVGQRQLSEAVVG